MNLNNLNLTKTKGDAKRVNASGVVFLIQAKRSTIESVLPRQHPVSLLAADQLGAAGFGSAVGDNYPLIVALNTLKTTAQHGVESNESWYLTPVTDADGGIQNLCIGQHVSNPRGWANGVFGQHIRQSFTPSLQPIRANGIGGGRVNTEPFSAGTAGSNVSGKFNQRIEPIAPDVRAKMYTLLNLPLIAESWFGRTYRQPWSITPTTDTSLKVKGTLTLRFLNLALADLPVSGFTLDARGTLGKPEELNARDASVSTAWYSDPRSIFCW